MGTNSVRRNLFNQNLSRRPASTAPPHGTMPPSNNGLSNRGSHRLKPTASDSSSSSRSVKMAENKDIVVRDKNGGYKLDVPALPRNTMLDDDGEELDELEAEESGDMGFDSSELREREKESMLGALVAARLFMTADSHPEFEVALVDMMIRHRNRQTTGEPDEILDIVHQSLRKKVNSLDDDNWMFEPEKDMRF